MEDFNKLIADPIFLDFLNTIEYPGYVVKLGDTKFIIILN